MMVRVSMILLAVFAAVSLWGCREKVEVIDNVGDLMGADHSMLLNYALGKEAPGRRPSVLPALPSENFIGCASGFLCSIIIGSILVVRFWPDHSAVFWAYTTACASGYTVTLFKAAAEVLKYSSHTFSSVVFYVVIGIAVALCLLQIHTLNLALRLGSAVTVVPVYFCLGMLMQLLQAHIAYKELHLLTLPRDIVPFFIGVGLVLISIFVLVRARIDDEVTVEAYKTESKRLSTAAASSTSLGPKLSSPKGKRTTGDQLPGDSQDKRETGDSYKRETGDSYGRFAGKASASTSTLGSETKDETSAAESTSEAERRPLRENRRTMSDGWYTFSDRCKALRSKSLSTYDINAFRNSFGKNQDRVYTLSLAGPPGIA
jgi:hypothetical protein